jgi:beta-lactamase regulating signal transducer with metallopeptidase domain
MLTPLIEAALRSLILALLVWAGLRIFRIRNVVSERSAWTVVLIGSLLMPFVLPLAPHWRIFSLAAIPAPASFEPLRATLATAPAAPSAAGFTFAPTAHRAPETMQAAKPEPSASAAHSNFGAAVAAPALNPASAESLDLKTPAFLRKISWVSWAALVYFLVAAGLLLRLLFGLASALRLWHTSAPVRMGSATQWDPDLKLRASHKISSPVTIGSGIVLPADYAGWTEEKLRVVLAHERSHVNQHDFHLQILASLYAALAWFSPLGWWLKRKLSDLGEAISDRSGLDAASNRSAYAQVLLEFAAAPRSTLIGVAMARNSNISRRIERLLNDSYLRHAFSGGVRSHVAVLMVPAVLFAATALVRVEAASHAQDESGAAPQIAQAQAALEAAQSQMQSAQLASAAQQAQKQAEAEQALSKAQEALEAAQARLHAQEQTANQAAAAQMLAEARAALEAAKSQMLERQATTQAENAQSIAEAQTALQAAQVQLLATREFALAVPPAPPAPPAAVENGAEQSEATFDRDLTFNGKLELSVGTGSGNITLKRGSANQIHIHGIVKASEGADPAQVQQIVANPPITQDGNSITIGAHQEHLHNISISYEIEAPADTDLSAATGSGNIADTGVGHDAKLTTGSGNIMATGLEGDFKTQTGSGNIAIEGSGQGDAKAQTGSGNIDLKGVLGALQAQTGSGKIKAEGKPSSAWKLQTGSGTIELATGNAPMNLDASTGSGKISTNPPVPMQNPEDHHHVRTQLNGGGPEVKVETGSGDIHVD